MFGLELGNNFAIFETFTITFDYLQNFTLKQKCLNFRPKVPDLGIFGQQSENDIAIFEMSTLEFV